MMTSPLLDLYAAADTDVRKRGRSWYPQTQKLLRELADKHERPLSQVVAVFAITSVAVQLQTNLRWTDEVLAGVRTGGRFPNVQGPLVAGALSTRRPSRFVRGPKTSAFYRAIMGDKNAVVLDRWAARAAGFPVNDEKHEIPVTVRREMAAAYTEAAKACRENVRDFQAIVWIVKRETTPTKKNIVPKLWDVSQDSEINRKEEQ